jgi:putative FmdB family regulatory protein
MPVYQYHCRSCGHDFQHTEPLRDHGHTRTACPKCKSTQVNQVLTPFFAKTARKA